MLNKKITFLVFSLLLQVNPSEKLEQQVGDIFTGSTKFKQPIYDNSSRFQGALHLNNFADQMPKRKLAIDYTADHTASTIAKKWAKKNVKETSTSYWSGIWKAWCALFGAF